MDASCRLALASCSDASSSHIDKRQAASGKSRTIVVGFILLLLFSLVSARWQYADATGEVCFNIAASSSLPGKLNMSMYGIMNITLVNNGAFSDYGLRAIHPQTGENIDVFKFADDGTNSYFFLPTVSTLTTAQQYCIYANSTPWNNLQRMAPANLAFDNSTTGLTADNTVPYTATWSGGKLTLTATGGRAGFRTSSIVTGTHDMILWAKYRPLSAVGSNGIISGRQSLLNAPFMTSSGGVGVYDGNMSGNWYVWTSGLLSAYNTSENIISIRHNDASTHSLNSTIWSTSMALINKTNRNVGTESGYPTYTYLAYANNSAAEYDWAISGKYPYNEVLTVSNVVYDAMDPNILILSPQWDSVYSVDDAVIASTQYVTAFDECNVSLNGVVQATYNPVQAGDVKQKIIDGSVLTAGENNITVNCDSGGTWTHKYTYFGRTGASAESLFDDAFGVNISSLCAATAQLGLGACYESYNLSMYNNFAAVVCKNLDTGINYSCVNGTTVTNITSTGTKNAYTIFYRPNTSKYADGTVGNGALVEHTGANFIYYGSYLDTGFELVDNDSFVYIPAQNQTRDCGVFYNGIVGTPKNCSWWKGFILNDGVVVISDRSNNWYTAGGAGINGFNYNVSQLVAPIQVYSILQGVGNLFSQGIYTRLNCYQQGAYYVIRIQNTLPQDYSMSVIGTSSSYSYTLSSTQFFDNVSTAGVTQILVMGSNGTVLCDYGGNTSIVLPFQLPVEMMPTGFNIMIWAMMLFSIVLTSIVPFAVIIPLMLNDIYHVVSMSEISMICIMGVVFGFVNSSFNMERGIKHLIIIIGLASAFMAAVSPYASEAGVNLGGFDDILKSFNTLQASNDIASFALGIPGFVISLFLTILTLPMTFASLILSMLHLLSPPLWTAASGIAPLIVVGATLYVYIKAYEVISNRFRPV